LSPDTLKTCAACKVQPGTLHQLDCDVERCPGVVGNA
jgi:hypothetical protein